MLEISENAMISELSGAIKTHIIQSEKRPSLPSVKPVKDTAQANAALVTLLELAVYDINAGRAMAELIPPEYISDVTPLGKALNLAINAALNDEMDELPGMLHDLLIETPCPEVSKVLFRPTEFQSDRRSQALNDAVKELIHFYRKKDERSLLEKLRNAVSESEKMSILTELQNSNPPKERSNME